VHRLRAVSAIGVRFPLHGTANGKAALAMLDDADAEAEISRFSPEVAEGLHRNRFRPRRTVGDNVVAIAVPAPPSGFSRRSSASSQHCARQRTRRRGRADDFSVRSMNS